MKQGWTYKKLGEVGTFSRGINFSKSDFVKEGYPCIHYGQIHTTFGPVIYEHLTCIPKEIVRKDKLASKGNLIIAITSEDVEASCKCTAWLGDYDIAIGAHAAIFKHQLNPIFVSYFFRSAKFQKEKEQYVHGFKVMEIKPSDIAKIAIGFPSLSEQQRIVALLDAAFAHIDELKANAEKQLSEARALFQKALSKAMEPKDGWKEKTLKEIGLTQTGTTPSKNDESNYGAYMPFIRPAELDYDGLGGVNYDSEISLSKKGVEKSRLIKENSILMCCIGSVGKMGFSKRDVTCNQQINAITPTSDYSPKFVYYAMLDNRFIDAVIKEAKSAQATLPIISKGKWEKHKLIIPPLSEQ